MEFLKGIFGDKELNYESFEAALSGNDKIKLANIANGAYVDRGKFDGKDKEHKEAIALIEELKKDNEGNAGLQSKIETYETTVSTIQQELEQTKLDAALKIALLTAKATDLDYLTYKIKSGEKPPALGEDGKIIGIEGTLAAIKSQYPSQFEAIVPRNVDENRLPDGEANTGGTNPKSLAEALQQNYEPKQE